MPAVLDFSECQPQWHVMYELRSVTIICARDGPAVLDLLAPPLSAAAAAILL